LTDEIKILVSYRLDRAKESLAEAKLLLESGHLNACVNRLYYAAFYAVNGLLLSRGLASARHSGVRSLFHQNFVKTGVVDSKHGRFFDTLYDNRQKGDYADMVSFHGKEVGDWLELTGKFIEVITRITLDSM